MKGYRKLLLPIVITLVIFSAFKVAEMQYTGQVEMGQATVQAGLLPLKVTTTAQLPHEVELDANTPQRVHPVRITGSIFFADELVPLEENDIRERFDRELLVNTFWHSNTILNYKLAKKYFGVIEPILYEYNVPQDFKYLAIAESGLRNVVSPAGASGFWQFMKKTGIGYDLEINSEVDERYHLEKATRAACEYLLEAKSKFGTWTLAAASYNMGMGGLNDKITKQKVDNYYDLYLNTETSRYVFRVLAYKMVFENPKDFGFYIQEDDLYEEINSRTVIVTNSIDDLAQYAIDRGTNYKTLKLLNPWLRSNSLTISEGNSYEIKIPV